MQRFSFVFVDEDLHDLAFPGELVLFADDLQEGDGVSEVEVAEVEALGGYLFRNAEVFEELFAGSALDGLVELVSNLSPPSLYPLSVFSVLFRVPFSFLFFSFSHFPLFPFFSGQLPLLLPTIYRDPQATSNSPPADFRLTSSPAGRN